MPTIETLGNFRVRWPKLPLEQKRKFLRLIAKGIEIDFLSPHWTKLTICWLRSVISRPDICFVWRRNRERATYPNKEELELIKTYYATCERATDLARLVPNQTWHAIGVRANQLGVYKDKRIKRIVDIPDDACYADIACFSDHKVAREMVDEATRHSSKIANPLYGIWVIPARLDEARPGLEGLLTNATPQVSLECGEMRP